MFEYIQKLFVQVSALRSSQRSRRNSRRKGVSGQSVEFLEDRILLSSVSAGVLAASQQSDVKVVSVPLKNLPGSAAQSIDITFTLSAGRSSFKELGVYAMDDSSGRVNGVRPEAAAFSTAVMASPTRKVLFINGEKTASTHTLRFAANAKLAVYVIGMPGIPMRTGNDHLQVVASGTNGAKIAWEEQNSVWPGLGQPKYDDAVIVLNHTDPFIENSAPSIQPIGTKSIPEQKKFTLPVKVTDRDLPNDRLQYSLIAAPSGARIDARTGVFTWTPTEAEGPGTFNVTVQVADRLGLTDTESFRINVREVNRRPLISAIPSQTANELSQLTVAVKATDPDLPQNSLTNSLVSAPSGAKIDSRTGIFRWTPTEAQGPGTFNVTVSVSDSKGLTDTETFKVTVKEVNRPPVIAPITPKTVNEQTQLTVAVKATDPDLNKNTLTYSLVTAPAGAKIDSRSGVFRWTPTEAQGPGTLSVTVRVSDGKGLADSETFKVTVKEVNRPPLITAITSKTVNEQSLLTFTVKASDPDLPKNTLTYSLVNPPAGATINSRTGVFRWTPTESQGPGVFSIKVKVSDGKGGTDTETFLVTVKEVNRSPLIAALAPKTVNEQSLLTFTVKSSDPDVAKNTLTYSLVNAPNGATINAKTGVFRWTPTEAQGAGVFNVGVRVSDGKGATDTETVRITVKEVNRPPVLAAIPAKTVNELSLLTFTAKATDPDLPKNTLTYSLVNAPNGATINAKTGVFRWTPTEAQGAGVFNVGVRVSDGKGAIDTETVRITVNEVNRPPVLAAISAKTINELSLLTFTAKATDADLPKNTLTYSLVNAPTGATINAKTGVFRWTPTEAQGAGVFNVGVRVSDGKGATDTETVRITVNEVNRPPVLAVISAKTVNELSLLTFTAKATDPDLPKNILTYSLVNAPTGATINAKTGVFRWTPTEAQGAGVFNVGVRVSDGKGAIDTETVRITVKEVNRPPVLAAISAKTINELSLLTFTAKATDPDLPKNTLTYSLVNAPTGATINAKTGVFRWTPTEAQGAGVFNVGVRVSDGKGATDTETVRITVKEVNRPPVLAAISAKTVNELSLLTFTATATDPDLPKNTLTYSLVSPPTGATINSKSGIFRWTPTENQGARTYNVVVRVSDGKGATDTETVRITVKDVNLSPLISAISAKTINELSLLTFTVKASDPDLPKDTLTFSLINAPTGAVIDSKTGVFRWTPSETQGLGSFSITVRVSDGKGKLDAKTFTVTVKEVNTRPILQAISNRQAEVGELLTFTARATDADRPNNTLTYSLAAGAPTGAVIDARTGVFRWTPTGAFADKTVSVTVRVTDSGSPALSATRTFQIAVRDCVFDDGLTDWRVTETGGSPTDHGTVVAQDCIATMTEGDSFTTTLSTSFNVPDNATSLSFTYANLNFDLTDRAFINDAFEVSLVDQDGDSLVPTYAANRDAFFNVTEGLPVAKGTGVTIIGTTITVNLSDVLADSQATLIFRLANNDIDERTSVQITDMSITGGTSPPLLNPAPAAVFATNIQRPAGSTNGLVANRPLILPDAQAPGAALGAQGETAPKPLSLVPISTSFNAPIGIDYHEPSNSILVTANYDGGQPFNFERIKATGEHVQFSNVAGLTDEVKIATVRSGVSTGFVIGDLFAGNGNDGEIVRITDDGNTVINPWVSLPGDGNGLLRGSLHVDRTGIFGGDLLAVTTGGEFWRIHPDGTSILLADVDVHLEGLTVIPDDPDRYGPLAGKAIAGAEGSNQLYAVGRSGGAEAFALNVAIEDIDLVPANENFFGVAFSSGQILGASAQNFDDMVGDILLTQEIDSGSGLHRLLWNGSSLTTVPVELSTDSVVPGHWEHVTFAPAGIVEITPVAAPPIISVGAPFTSGTIGTSLVLSGNATAFSTPGSEPLNQIEMVTANGKPVDLLDSSGRLWLSTQLKAGENVYEFIATDSYGRTATTRISIFGTEAAPTSIDLSRFVDTTGSFTGVYGRTSFEADTNKLYVDLATRNDGTFTSDVPLLVGIRNISDPLVSVIGANGTLPDGTPYFDFTQFVTGGKLGPGQLSGSPTISFHNPTRGQFDYDLVFLGKLNEAPEITTVPRIEAIAGKTYRYDLDARDADNDVLAYSLTNAPAGMQINATTGLITWTPTTSNIGQHDVTVKVTDGRGGSATQRFTLQVIIAPPNRPPVITSMPVTDTKIVASQMLGNGYADVVLEYFAAGASGIPEPYGRNPNGQSPESVSPNNVLGPPPQEPRVGWVPTTRWLSLPAGSFITLGFNDEVIIDGPGNDIYIRSLDPEDSAGEVADVYVSTDLNEFVFLGRTPQGGNVGLDLAALNLSRPVKAVRVVGVDNVGSSPGFDLVSVEVLPNSLGNAGDYFYDVEAIDADEDTLNYSLVRGPAGMTIDSVSGLIHWRADSGQARAYKAVDLSPVANYTLQQLEVGATAYPKSSFNVDGIPFFIPKASSNIWHSEFQPGNNPRIAELAVSEYGVTEVHALINTYWGVPGPASYAEVEFETDGGLVHRVPLLGDVDVRDYLQNFYTNSVNHTTTVPAFSEIVTLAGESREVRLDRVTFTLPPEFAKDVLKSIRFIDTGGTSLQRIFVSGVTVGTVLNKTLAGEFEVEVAVEDGVGGVATQAFTVCVHPVEGNHAPVIVSQPVITVNRSVTSANGLDNYQYDVDAVDADSETLEYTLTQGPAGMTIDKSTGVINWPSTNILPPDLQSRILTGPIRNPANGHDYYLLAPSRWTDAEGDAVKLGGHLATVRNLAENDWIYSTFSKFDGVDRGLWIGLNDVENEGTFEWTSGEKPSYMNWGGGEPATQSGTDDFVHLFWPGESRQSTWNDIWDEGYGGTPGHYFGIPISGVVEVIDGAPVTVRVTDGRGGTDEQSFSVKREAAGGEISGTKWNDVNADGIRNDLIAAGTTFFGPLPYLQKADSPFSSWFSDGKFWLEDFEDGLLNTPGVSATSQLGLSVNGLSVSTDSVDGDDGIVDGNGQNGHMLNPASNAVGASAIGMEFHFDATILGGLPTVAGIVWTDGTPNDTIIFEAFRADGTSLGKFSGTGIGDGSFFGTTAEDRFFGVSSTEGISKIKINGTITGANSFDVDHLQYGIVSATTEQTTFTAADSFSPTQNPNGQWVSGWQPLASLGSNFTPFTQSFPILGPEIQGWSATGAEPAVFFNPSSLDFFSAAQNITVLSRQLVLHPGAAGQYAIERFIAPNDGLYSVDSIFDSVDGEHGGTDVHVLVNGVSIFDSLVTTTSVNFSRNSIKLSAGDTVDFAVGYGSNSNFSHDSTALNAKVVRQLTKEPGLSSWPIYIDLNNNAQRDRNEPTTVTDTNGDYVFSGLTAGTYIVREDSRNEWQQTFPVVGQEFELVENGSFETLVGLNGDGVLFPGSAALSGWEITAGSIDYISAFFSPSHGTRSLDMTGTPGAGSITQTINTVAGTTYRAYFDLAGNPYAGPALKQLRVTAGAVVQDFDFSIVGRDGTNMGWTREFVEFTATGSSTAITFTSLTDGYAGPTIDNVSVKQAVSPGAHVVTLSPGQIATGLNFGNTFTGDPANARPEFQSTPVTNAVRNQLYRYDAVATDPNNDPLIYGIVSGPEGITVHPKLGAVVWVPSIDQVGSHSVVISVRDDKGEVALQQFTIEVLQSNAAPSITSTAPVTGTVDNTFVYEVQAQDADRDSLTFALDTKPTGMNIDPATGRITWTPASDQAGNQNVVVAVSDGRGGRSTQAFTVAVAAVGNNSVPVFTSTPRPRAFAGHLYGYAPVATDANGDGLTYSLVSGPAGLILNSNNLLEWTPTFAQAAAKTHAVSIKVSDGKGGDATQTFDITVGTEITNDPPVITSNPRLVAIENQTYVYDLKAFDADADPLLWSLELGPAGMSIDPVLGTLRWTPQDDQMGANSVVVTVTDLALQKNTQRFVVDVRCTNQGPAILSIPPTSAIADRVYLYPVRAVDPEQDVLLYDLTSSPAGMSINPVTGVIRWTPGTTQIGLHDIVITATDSSGAVGRQLYKIKVSSPTDRLDPNDPDSPPIGNRPPLITSTPVFSAEVEAVYEYPVIAVDPDGDDITFSAAQMPSGMTIDATTGVIRWTPTAAQAGEYTLIITVTDSNNAVATQGFILVAAVNQPPVISSQPVRTLIAGAQYRYSVRATDPEGDALSYSLDNAPSGMSIDRFGRILWQSAASITAPQAVTVRVSDSRGKSVTQSFTITMAADTEAPKVSLLIRSGNFTFTGNGQVNVNASYTVTVLATDNVGIAEVGLLVDGQRVVLNSANSITLTASQLRNVQLEGMAKDTTGLQGRSQGVVSVVNAATTNQPVPETPGLPPHPGFDPNDNGRPNVTITSPVSDSNVSNLVPIIGTVDDPEDNLWYYRVYYARTDLVSIEDLDMSDSDWVHIKTSTIEVTNGELAMLDTRTLSRDSYVIIVAAYDGNGQGQLRGAIVNVEGNLLLGNFRIEFTDLNIPLAGIPIQISRVYDTLDASEVGDFGHGWTMGVQDARIRETVPKGGEFVPGKTRVYLTGPDGRRIGFTYEEELTRVGFLGSATFRPYFRADRGVYETLEIDTQEIARGGIAGVFNLVGQALGSNIMNPEFYTLTTKDGLKYRYHETDGLQTITDRNGNFVTFKEDGVFHSDGQSIQFVRDNKGRLVRLIDPAGKEVRYQYNVKGDLIVVADRVNIRTDFRYSSQRDHYLVEILDPLGRMGTRTEYDAEGRLSAVFDVNGASLSFTYNPSQPIQKILDPNGNVILMEYDARGNSVTIVDQLGNVTRQTFDSNDNLLSRMDGEGNTTYYQYDSKGNRTSEIAPHLPLENPDDYTTHFTYNDNGQLTTIAKPGGGGAIQTYDANGNLLTVLDMSGSKIIQYDYDSRGLVVTETQATGTTHYTYDASGNQVTVTDLSGVTLTSTFDSLGQVLSTTDSQGNSVQVTYDAAGRKLIEDFGNGNSVIYAYNAAGELASMSGPKIGTYVRNTDPAGRFTGWDVNGIRQETYTYNKAGQVLSHTDAAGNVRTFEYDISGRLVRERDAMGVVFSRTYDKAGKLTSEVDASGNMRRFAYLPNGTLSTVVDANGNSTTFEYSARSQSVTDPLGRTMTTFYNPQGLVESVVLPDGSVESYRYNGTGVLDEAADSPIEIIDRGGNVRRYTYGLLGELVEASSFSGAVYEYTYDTSRNLTTVLSPTGETIKYVYDSLNRIEAMTHASGSTDQFSYDAFGNVVSVIRASGSEVHSQFDGQQRIVERSTSDGIETNYLYNGAGLLAEMTDQTGVTSYRYDVRGNMLSMAASSGGEVTYSRDALDRIIAVTLSSPGQAQVYTTRYSYDAVGNYSSISDPFGGVTTFSYDAANHLKERMLPNGVVTSYSYDVLGQLVSIIHADPQGAVLASVQYVRQGLGQPTRIYREDGSYVNLAYDSGLRLTKESYFDAFDAAIAEMAYDYDSGGRRISVETKDDSLVYEYSEGGELSRVLSDVTPDSIYTFDADGRRRSVRSSKEEVELFYDALDRLVRVHNQTSGQTTVYSYDGAGRRVRVETESGVLQYVIAPTLVESLESPHMVLDASGSLVAGYVFAGEHPLMRFDQSGIQYYLQDAMGSVIALANQNAVRIANVHYDSFGDILANSETAMDRVFAAGGDFLYHGAWYDPYTDLYHMRAREYDSGTGMFLTRDPVAFNQDVPESFESYAFAYANPHLYRDPKGTTSFISGAIQASIAQMVRSQLISTAGSVATRFLEPALNLFGVPIPNDLREVLSGGGKKAGSIFENLVINALCGAAEAVLPGSLAKWLWFEVAIDPQSGRPRTDGYSCGDGGSRSRHKRGDAFPDIIISPYAPSSEVAKEGWPKRDLLTTEIKIGVNTAYNKWVKSNNSQKRAIGNHAKGFQYVPVAVLIAFNGEKRPGQELWIRKTFIQEFGVVMHIVSVR